MTINRMEYDRESGGQLVREIWIKYVKRQENPKPSHLLPWDHPDFPEEQKEADRFIWEHIVAPYIKEQEVFKAKIRLLEREVAYLRNSITTYQIEIGEEGL